MQFGGPFAKDFLLLLYNSLFNCYMKSLFHCNNLLRNYDSESCVSHSSLVRRACAGAGLARRVRRAPRTELARRRAGVGLRMYALRSTTASRGLLTALPKLTILSCFYVKNV